jgi:hypothetical protein
MNCARPSIRIPCAVMSGAIALSTRMAVPALTLCDRPRGMPPFQKELPCPFSGFHYKAWHMHLS